MSQPHRYGRGVSQAHDATQVLLNQMIRKEKEYLQGIQENQSYVIGVGNRLSLGGTVEQLLVQNASNNPSCSSSSSKQPEDWQEQLDSYRNSAKALAEQNIEHERQIKAYVQGLRYLLDNPPQASQSTSGGDEKEDEEEEDPFRNMVDYSKAIKEAMGQARAQIQETALEIEQEEHYRNLCQELGEPVGGNGQGGGEDDEDIAVVPTNPHAAAGGPSGIGNDVQASLLCPITRVLMTDPYKNKICGHVYDKLAIFDHIKKDKRGRCPVAGCSNSKITQSQLQQDLTTCQLIRREKIRLQTQSKTFSQNAIDMDEDEDDA